MLRALLAGFGKTNARALAVAGLVWPLHYRECPVSATWGCVTESVRWENVRMCHGECPVSATWGCVTKSVRWVRRADVSRWVSDESYSHCVNNTWDNWTARWVISLWASRETNSNIIEEDRRFVINKQTNNNDLLGKDGLQRIAYTKIYGLTFKVSSVHIDCCYIPSLQWASKMNPILIN